MALLTRSMILVLFFFFFFIDHSFTFTLTLSPSLSFIDCAAYVRFGVGSRHRARHTNACPTTTRGTVGNKRGRRKNDCEKRKRNREKTKMRAQKKERRYSFFLASAHSPSLSHSHSLPLPLLLPSSFSSSTQHILTTYNSDPMDGLREIHFGERSLSLSHLYKNDSRRCIPVPVVVAPDLFAGLILLAPCCCCCRAWFWVDAEETLWWELTTPRGDDDEEPSTSKLNEIQRRTSLDQFGGIFVDKSSSIVMLSHNHRVIADAHHSTAVWASLHTLINGWICCFFGLAKKSIWMDMHVDGRVSPGLNQ